MNVNAGNKGKRVVTLETARGRRLAKDFPGWGKITSENADQYLLPIPAGEVGVITSVNSHGAAPYTRYGVKLDDGTRIIDAELGRDIWWAALTDAELLDQFALASAVPVTSLSYPDALEVRQILRAELMKRMSK